jgi:hypothetical protein
VILSHRAMAQCSNYFIPYYEKQYIDGSQGVSFLANRINIDQRFNPILIVS